MFWRQVSDWIHFSMKRRCKDKRATVGDVWVHVHRVDLENCAHTYRYLIKRRQNRMFVCLSPYLYFYASLNQEDDACICNELHFTWRQLCDSFLPSLSLLLCCYKDCGIEMLIRQGCDWPRLLGDKWQVALIGLHFHALQDSSRLGGAIIGPSDWKRETVTCCAPWKHWRLMHIYAIIASFGVYTL